MSSPKPSSSWICQACISWTPGQETHVIWNGSPPDLVCSHPESLGYVEGLSFTSPIQQIDKNIPKIDKFCHTSDCFSTTRWRYFNEGSKGKNSSHLSWSSCPADSDRDVFGTGKSQVTSPTNSHLFQVSVIQDIIRHLWLGKGCNWPVIGL